MKYHFCTCFDNNYLLYGYTLYNSLRQTGMDFTLYIVCLDAAVYDNLKVLSLPCVELISIKEVEEADPEYAATAQNRNKIEYIFTLSPVMPLYLLQKHPEIEILAYLDADLYFYSSLEKIYQLLENRSVLIVEHDFYPDQEPYAEKYGRFNMAFQLYRNDARGRACLEYWRKQCIQWCYDRVEDGKFADQKYLEEWPDKFQAVIVPHESGAGLAPWNCGKHSFDFSRNVPRVDDTAVIYYHYQGCKIMEFNILVTASEPYPRYISNSVSDFFYQNYYKALCSSKKELAGQLPPERLNFIYQYQRERSSGNKHSIFFRIFSRYIAKIPLLFNGILTCKGKRVAPLIFRLFYYRNPGDECRKQ